MITLKQPAFWRKKALLAFVLWPISLIYRAGYALHHMLRKAAPPPGNMFVICVGNITAGGTGKTPVAMALADHLFEYRPVILTKGYGGHLKGPVYVNEKQHSASDVGDEALMMARRLYTVIICKDRLEGLHFAHKHNHSLVIMDDGLQNPSFQADYNICVMDAEFGLGNGFLIPAGPLRQSLESAIPSTDTFITIGDDAQRANLAIPKAPIQTHFELEAFDIAPPYFAFAGIGRPEKFFASLRSKGARILGQRNFPDHHVYTDTDIASLREDAARLNARLITTEKDAVKLPDLKDITIAKGYVHFDIPSDLTDQITSKLTRQPQIS